MLVHQRVGPGEHVVGLRVRQEGLDSPDALLEFVDPCLKLFGRRQDLRPPARVNLGAVLSGQLLGAQPLALGGLGPLLLESLGSGLSGLDLGQVRGVVTLGAPWPARRAVRAADSRRCRGSSGRGLTTRIVPEYSRKAPSRALQESMSRWFVGSSSTSSVGRVITNLASARRLCSPPERSPTCLKTSSSTNRKRAKKGCAARRYRRRARPD